MTLGPRLLLATRNVGKVSEIRSLDLGCELTWECLEGLADVPEPAEVGATFAENAQIKALHYAACSGLPALADDSGLCVDALGGEPGVHSARYAGVPRDDAANNRKLIANLAGVPAERCSARFVCAMALAVPGRVLLETEGCIEGRMVAEARGSNGFGYDPHFYYPPLRCTLAELAIDAKNAVSHRSRALRAMLARLRELIEE